MSTIPHAIEPTLWEQIQSIRWLSTADAARLLGVTVSAVSDAVRDGKLRGLKSQGEGHTTTLLPESEVLRWMRTRRSRGPASKRPKGRPCTPRLVKEALEREATREVGNDPL